MKIKWNRVKETGDGSSYWYEWHAETAKADYEIYRGEPNRCFLSVSYLDNLNEHDQFVVKAKRAATLKKIAQMLEDE